MALIDKIQKAAEVLFPKVLDLRKHIHANPELSFQEHKTAEYIANVLSETGLKPVTGIAQTGVTALIEGKNPTKKIIALRADIDALPITESNEVPYKSKNQGVMHACGHDVHTSSLLGTAMILNDLKNEFEGTVKLIFQPGEEKAPGGASMMIKEGVLKNPAPEKILGQHVAPLIPVGKIGFKEGVYMASADEIYLTVKGQGGHGAMPDRNIDPVLIASHIIVALQQIVSRNASPMTPTVLSFGKVIANGATNIIPNEVKIEGTFRTLDEKWRDDAHQKIKNIAENIAKSMGGTCDVHIMVGYPYLYNEEMLTRRCRQYASDYVGEENIVDMGVWMAAEDFAFYSHEIDACFYRLGVRNEAKGIISNVHTSTFNIDEDALKLSTGLMAWMTINELSQ